MAGGVDVDSPYVVPNGGWGWAVVFASFLLQLLSIGITYTFGVLFVALLEEFGESEATTSWIGSIQPCLLYFTGCIASPLIQTFGWRWVTIGGSVLSCIGFATSALVNRIEWLYLTYGVLTGIGNGLMYVTSMVTIQHYFTTRRSIATGIAVSGSGVGTLIFGWATQTLLDKIGWRMTLITQAGIVLLGIFCGALYKPLPLKKKKRQKATAVGAQQDTEAGEKAPLIPEGEPVAYTPANNNVIGEDDDSVEEEEPVKLLDFSIARNPMFVVYCCVIVCFCFGYHVPFTYTPERANKLLGTTKQQSSWLVSVMGISNVVSRLTLGPLADRNKNTRFFMGGFALALGGLSSVAIPVFSTYKLMIVYSVLFGAFTGCWASLFPVILVDLLGVNNIERSMGLCLASGSGAFLLASPMAGWIIASTGSYDSPFMVFGSIMAFGGLIYFINLPLRSKYGPEAVTIVEAVEDKPTKPRPRRISYASESFS